VSGLLAGRDDTLGRRLAVPLAAALVTGLASTVPSTFPAQALFQTLVIAQASLLAIVVSVSMMSMQVSTNRFAPQLSQLYRESGFNAIIARFGLSILLDLSLFALPVGWLGLVPVRVLVVATVVGVASWAFVSLLEIEERLLVFLNPDPVLDSLVASVSFDRYHAFSVDRHEEGRVARNPILELYQVAQTSLEQNDNYSALRAVDALDEATEQLLSEYASLSTARREETAPSVHKLFDYWNRIADAAVERGADDVLHAVVEAEAEIGREAVDLGLTAAAVGAVDAVYHFCAVTLANNRLETQYHGTLSDLLGASLEASELDVARRAVTDLARLSRLVDRREDDLLVAADERITPHEAFFENWAYFLREHQSQLSTERCRSLHAHYEQEYQSIYEEAIADGRVGAFGTVATPGLRAVARAAAEREVQWVVSRGTEHLLALGVRTDTAVDSRVPALERVVEAGGAAGVADAIRRLRDRTFDDRETETAARSRPVSDPLSDGSTDSTSEDTTVGRPIKTGVSTAELHDRLDAVAHALSLEEAERTPGRDE
jgi:hypothetical protein